MKRLLSSVLSIVLFTAANGQEKGAITRSNALTDTSPIDFDRRVALVIGNASYETDKLKNPTNDANAIATTLRNFGFKVILDSNLNRSTTLKRINEFGDSITRKKGVSLFYYSGHGMQYLSENYMLPIQSTIEREEDIENEAVKLSKLLDKMGKTGNALNIVILDACRNNIFQEKLPALSKGLTDKESLPGNTYLFFAASPGRTALDGTGTNSPFTESLVNNIKDSVEFFQVVKKVIREVKSKTNPQQQPALAGSPEDDFIFIAKRTGNIPRSFLYKREEIIQAGPLGFHSFDEEMTEEMQVENANRSSTLYILSIGISRYKDLPSLAYARKDAMDMANALRLQAGSLYDSVSTYILVDEFATQSNIYKSINAITKKAKAGDMIMMFFGGHNVTSEFDKSSYFITYDAAQKDEAMLMQGSISFEKVRDFLANAPCKSILFMDGAYSPDAAQNLSAIENGVAVLASTREGESSLEGREWNNGLFTKTLIDGMAGFADADSSGYVNLDELSRYVRINVEKQSMGRQHPTHFFNSVLRSFKIVKALPPEKLKELRDMFKTGLMKAER